jgi:diguanylate cyclase (GGDEF)-like protein
MSVPPKPRVLIADDDAISLLFLVETLGQAGFETVAVGDGAAALMAAQAQPFDVALLDVDMPVLDGYEVCRAMRRETDLQHLPIVMITGYDDPDSIAHAYADGATDFISKPVNCTLLPHRLRYILRNSAAERQLRHLAYHDALTALPNAESLGNLVVKALARAATAGDEGVAIIHIDVQGCSRIRAIFGPDEGDAALRAFAERLAATVAASVAALDGGGERACVARIDGDRFVVCLRASAVEERAVALADQIIASLDEPVYCGKQLFLWPPAVGIAFSTPRSRDAKALITRAAAAKHHALLNSITSAVIYSADMSALAHERMSIEAALREAVRTEQLSLHFQPKVDITNGALVGVEALIRWFDPILGEVSPEKFVPLAEESGLILDIGRWVTQAACRQIMNWQMLGFNTSIAINLSARQFVHDDPATMIREAARAVGIDPSAIIVEITESALIRDLASVQAGLLAVRALGCRIAIDDFGTGYSSLAYLKGLPVDDLKIDKSFVRNLVADRVDAAICQAILSLAHEVGLSVVAEGVETVEQLDWLRVHRCDIAQGYWIARPMTGREILERYGSGTGMTQKRLRIG